MAELDVDRVKKLLNDFNIPYERYINDNYYKNEDIPVGTDVLRIEAPFDPSEIENVVNGHYGYESSWVFDSDNGKFIMLIL